MGPSQVVLERVEADLVLVTMIGEHDLEQAAGLRERLGAVQAEGCSIVLDLTPTGFVDSSILAAIVEAFGRAREAGLAFVIALGEGAAREVRRVLEVTGLVRELNIAASADEALEAARSGGG